MFLIFVRIGYHEKTHGERTNQTLPCYKVGGGAAEVARSRSHVNPGVAAKAGEAVNRNKYNWVVRGFVMHKQAYMMAKLIEELRREQQQRIVVDFANGVR